MQEYTHDLITNELGLENLIMNSTAALEREREAIQAAAEMTEEQQQDKEEAKLFDYLGEPVTDQDFIDFKKDQEEEEEEQI